jgi:hypothetical protein
MAFRRAHQLIGFDLDLDVFDQGSDSPQGYESFDLGAAGSVCSVL